MKEAGIRAPVAYVLRYWPTLTETFVYREITALQAAGQPVVVVAMGARPDGGLQDELPDVEVLGPARGRALVSRGWPLRSKPDARASAWAAQLAARGVKRVHAHFAGEAAFLARTAAAALGVPWSVTAHAVDLFKPAPGLAGLLRDARPVVTVCEHHRSWIVMKYAVDAVVVPCAARRDVPVAAPEREPARVVAVARDVPKKDLERLVRSCRAREVALRLVGGGQRFAGPGVEVGDARPSEIPGILASMQLFALPVRVAPDGDRDGVPVAMLEAMAAGLPVVTRPVAGVPEIVDPTVGWIGPDFEAQLDAALADPAGRATRGAAARARLLARPSGSAAARLLLAAWDRGDRHSDTLQG